MPSDFFKQVNTKFVAKKNGQDEDKFLAIKTLIALNADVGRLWVDYGALKEWIRNRLTEEGFTIQRVEPNVQEPHLNGWIIIWE